MGELRTRTERYATFPADGDEAFAAIDALLSEMATREPALVRNVGREPGQSQDRWIQLLDGGAGPATPTSAPAVAPAHTADATASPAPAHTADATASPAPAASGVTSPGASPATPASAAAHTPPAVSMEVIEDLMERISRLEQRVSDLEELL